MSNTTKVQRGFTLIELMIVVAIIGILASVAVPAYRTFTLKAKFTEVIALTATLKTGVEFCAQNLGSLQNCYSGANGVPAANNILSGKFAIESATVGNNGIISAFGSTGIVAGGFVSYSYILTPTLAAEKVTWAISGTCVANGLC